MTFTTSPLAIQPIAMMRCGLKQKFGLPRQSLLGPNLFGELELLPPFNHKDYVEGLESTSHVWVIFVFHQNASTLHKAKVRPPRLGGNQKLGVLATRSSYRPNNLGLSVLKLEGIDCRPASVKLQVSGIDLVDGTPIVDIKPYIPYADCVESAWNTFATAPENPASVVFSEQAGKVLQHLHDSELNSEALQNHILDLLQHDPRPAYHANDANKMYKVRVFSYDVHFYCQSMHSDSTCFVVSDIESVK